MTVITKNIGRLPQNIGNYDSSKAYGKMNRVILYGCEWQSLIENNTHAPATLVNGVVTPDTIHWRLVSGVPANYGLDGKLSAETARAMEVEGGHETRISDLEESVGTGGSVDERIAAEGEKHYLKTETYTKEEVNGMITTPDQDFVTVEATEQTTAATDVLPATGEANTIYRVANWDGSQYSVSVYSEYTWNTATSSYVKLDTKSIGIDDVPTAGSDNLVKSGGVALETALMANSSPLRSSSTTTVVEMDIANGEEYKVYLKSDINVGGYIRVGLGGSGGVANRSVAVSPEDVLAGKVVSLVSVVDGSRIYTASTDAQNHDALDDYSDFNTQAVITWRIQPNEFDNQVERNRKKVDKVDIDNNYYTSIGSTKFSFPNIRTIKFDLTIGGITIRNFGHTENNKIVSPQDVYDAIIRDLGSATIATDGVHIDSYDETAETRNVVITIGANDNRLTCLYDTDSKTIRFTAGSYNKNNNEIVAFTIVGRREGLVCWDRMSGYMQSVYEKTFNSDYKIQEAYYSSSLADVPILFDFPVIANHQYELSIKSVSTLTDGAMTVGLGYNGTFGSFTTADLNNGNFIKKVATMTKRSRLYMSSISGDAKNKDFIVTLRDITMPLSLKEDKDVKFKNSLGEYYTQWNRLYIGKVDRTTIFQNATPAITSNHVVASLDHNIAIPYNGCTFKLHMPSYVRCNILHSNNDRGVEPLPSTGQSGWLHDRESFTFPVTSSWYRLAFCYLFKDADETVEESYTNNISGANIISLIRNGQLYIEYNDYASIIDNNKGNEYYIKGMMYKNPINGTIGDNPSSTYGKVKDIPVISHISDIHGDSLRFKNFLEYSDYLGVDAEILSGDFVGYNSVSGVDFLNELSSEHNDRPQFFCIGNHEKNGWTQAQMRTNIISKFATRNGYTLGSETNANYYFKDLAEQKLRIIVLNQYDNDTVVWIRSHISSTQMNWFISVLESTPQDYGVILVTHSWEYYKVRYNEEYSNFFDVVHKDGSMYPMEGYPIEKIIDAFISKTSVTGTYTQTIDDDGTTSTPETVSYSADFSEVASGVEFIMWLNGHEHRDHIGYLYGSENPILTCNISCGVATYEYGDNHGLASICDMPRGGQGQTQDCFNIYGIDREDGVVRIARVGANIDRYMKDRKWMIIPYKDNVN